MRNMKKILVLSLFLVAIIGIIAPVNAALYGWVGGNPNEKVINGKIKLSVDVTSDIGLGQKDWKSSKYAPKRKAELNKVNKVVITIKGYKPITFKKPVKGWKTTSKGYEGRPYTRFSKSFSVKGTQKTLISKEYTIKLYDKNNKLLKDKNKGKGKITFGE